MLDGDALSEAQMQAIAKQAGFSECAFVCRSDKADLRLRFFMPLQETGLCGHATVASICALMEQDARWRGKSELLVETASGVLPIRYRAETNEVMMTQAPAQFAPFGGDREALMASIGLHAEDLDESLPLVYGSTGVWTLIVLVRDLAAFERMQPDNQRFPAVLTENPCASVHPITRETRHSEAQMHGRHFSSAFAGTAEDPVTGTASGVMGAYALRYLQPDAAAVDLVVEQGQEIGKDGIVGVHAAREGENVFLCQLKGKCAPCLAFGAVGLIHHPIADGREQASVGGKIAEQEAMVGNDDIGGLGLAARTVDEAGRAAERAFATQAIVARGGDHPARQRAIVDLQAVDVVVSRLLNEGKQGGKGRSLRFLLLPHGAHAGAFHNEALHLVQTGIVGEPLESSIGEVGTELLRKSGKLMIDQLVEESVRLSSYADINTVISGNDGRRQKIGHGFAHACSCLHHKIARSGKRIAHCLGHSHLLAALLVLFVQGTYYALSGERLGHSIGRGEQERSPWIGGDFIGIHERS